jgi:PIN domain nuclease of toxin-antitoxin system
MRNSLVLVDTHILLWLLYEPSRLPRSIFMLLRDSQTRVHVSTVSLWEISIKVGLKKLLIPGLNIHNLIDIVKEQNFTMVDMNSEDAIWSITLSTSPHKDPFDRMLAWQAISRNLVMVSADDSMAAFEGFGLKRFEFNDTDFLLNEEIEAYNAMVDES